MRTKSALACEVVRYVFLILIAVALFFPFVFMVVNSLKSDGAFIADKWTWIIDEIRWDNYAVAFEGVGRYLWNSVYLAVVISAATVLISAVSAYIFAMIDFPFKKALFFAIIMVMMIPGILTFIPQFIIIRDLGFYDSHWAVILPGIAGGQIFTIFVLRSFFAQLPYDLVESARIDGAGNLTVMFRIIMPLAMPMLTTMLVLAILGQWNSYLWPYTVLPSEEQFTVPVGIKMLSKTGYTRTTVQYAAYTIVSLPLIVMFSFTMDKFVKGLTSGAIKG